MPIIASFSTLLQRYLQEANDGGRSSDVLRSCRGEALRGASDFAAARPAALPRAQPVGASVRQRRSYLPEHPDYLALNARLRQHPRARAGERADPAESCATVAAGPWTCPP